MRTKAIVVLLGIVIGLVTWLLMMREKLDEARNNVDRLTMNQRALMDSMYVYKALDGLNAWQIRNVELKKKEFEETNNTLKHEVEKLKIKVKDLQSAEKAGTKTEYLFKVDTVFVAPDKATLRYSDHWIDFELDSLAHIVTRDTITIVRHQKVKRFLWWVRRRDKYVTVKNANPHARITAIETIDITE